MHIMRILIQCLIVGGNSIRNHFFDPAQEKDFGIDRYIVAIAATAWGGSSVQINETLRDGPAIGLDWFLLDLLLMGLIYVPLETLWPQYPEQGTFRKEWTLGCGVLHVHSSPNSNLVFSGFIARYPSHEISGCSGASTSHRSHALAFAVFLAVVVADVAEYFIHLALHKVPFLWRFHAVHHSSKALDWIAGSRSHFVDDTLVRGFILVPLMFGFSQSIIFAYLFL